MIFSESTPIQVAELFPAGGGYSGFLYGKVVDMFYFPIIDTTLPEWVPSGESPFYLLPSHLQLRRRLASPAEQSSPDFQMEILLQELQSRRI